MIRLLRLQNFKCFENQSFRMGPLTVLTGLNNTGKSSVIQSLLLLRQSYQEGLLATTGLALKGDLVNIGKGTDALFEGAKEEIIGFELALKNGIGLWRPRLFFKTLTTKLSYIPDLPEFWYGEDQARGLGFAFQYEHLALSLRSERFWYSGRIELEVRYPELDENDQIVTERVEAIHASSSDHVLEHADWIKKRIKTEIHEGSDLWNRREELFANLQFCESVEAQLKDLKFGNWLLHLVERKLFELEDFCEQWQARGDAFDVNRIPGKGGSESEATLTEYGEHRTFRCPDGEHRVFSFHIRITRNWRVYYFPIGEKQQIFIGYIGEHLPTKKYS